MRLKTGFHIDLGILKKNVEKLRARAPHNKILFMVKANAYGHGVVPIVRYCVEELGIREFGCAATGEARQLRRELPDLEFDIFVFSDVQLELRFSKELYLNQRILPVISSLNDLEEILQDRDFKFFPLCIKFNTGMNRLGIPFEQNLEVIDLLKKYGRDSVYHLLSHFCCASQSIKNKRTQLQYERFLNIKQSFQEQGIKIENSSMANSGAIEQNFALEETHIRPGLMLYGPSALNPGVESSLPWQGELIGSFKTYVISSFQVQRGTPVGYGGTIIHDDGTIALLAAGYGDGLPTYCQGAPMFFHNYEGKVFGRVNMDMMQIFFPKSSNCPIKTGDHFLLWGDSRERFDYLCQSLKVIPYELLCLVSSRIPRLYKH